MCSSIASAVVSIICSRRAPKPVPPERGSHDDPAWLATAGAGDVLAGVVGTLLAAGLAPDLAGALGALVHGEAAHDANPGGPVRALDVAQEVGRTVARLLAASAR